MRRPALIVACLCVLGAGLWYRISVHPWHAEPDEAAVSAAWKAVEEAAVFDPEATGDAASWEKVGTAAAAASAAIEAARRKPAADWGDLDPAILTAAEALMSWNDARGALVTERCAIPSRLLSAFTLVQVGLASLHVSSGPFVTATQRLARLLRHGGSYLSYAVGMAITDELRRWAIREKVTPDESFRLLAPIASEKHAALARDATCGDQVAVTGPAILEAESPSQVPWHARRFVDAGRERRMTRLFFGSLLTRCASQRNDPTAYDDCTKIDTSDLPKSILVRSAAIQAPPHATKVIEYAAFLK